MTTSPLTKVSIHQLAGREVRCSGWTAGHLQATIARLAVEHPKARLIIVQPCYNTGVDESAGTHDRDGVFDVIIQGLGWWDAQAFLRRCDKAVGQ